MSSQFYVTLPSNSSMDLYPENKISNFKINFSNPFNLDASRWEVGLSEIQFPHRWYNIRSNKNILTKTIHKPIEKHNIYKNTRIRSIIPEGHYNSIEELVKRLNNNEERIAEIYNEKSLKPIKFSYNALNKRVQIEISEDWTLDFDNSDIARCLGFNPTTKITNQTAVSETLASTTHMYDSVYVYTDIIENQNVGHLKAPLLRVVPVTSKYGEVCCVKYDKPHFFALSRGNINTIEINLRSDTGDLISFEAGKAIVTLVFRKKISKFFD